MALSPRRGRGRADLNGSSRAIRRPPTGAGVTTPGCLTRLSPARWTRGSPAATTITACNRSATVRWCWQTGLENCERPGGCIDSRVGRRPQDRRGVGQFQVLRASSGTRGPGGRSGRDRTYPAVTPAPDRVWDVRFEYAEREVDPLPGEFSVQIIHGS